MLHFTLTVVLQVILRQLLKTLDLQSLIFVILHSYAVLTELLLVIFWQVVRPGDPMRDWQHHNIYNVTTMTATIMIMQWFINNQPLLYHMYYLCSYLNFIVLCTQ